MDGSSDVASLDSLIKSTTAGHNHDGVNSRISAHASQSVNAHQASAVAVANGNWTGDDVEEVLEEVSTRLGNIEQELASKWTFVNKPSDESRLNNTLAADTHLKFTMAANSVYKFMGIVFFDTAATPDFKWRHAGPASPTLVRICRKHITPGTTTLINAVDTAYSTSDIAIAGSGSTGGYIEIDAVIHNGANAGDFEFRWAQNTTDGSAAATVRAGSYLAFERVA